MLDVTESPASSPVSTAPLAIFAPVTLESASWFVSTAPSARLPVPTAPAASLAAVTAPSASFALVTPPSASFAPVTLPSASLEVVTAPSIRSGGAIVPSRTFADDTEPAASFAPVTAPPARSAVCTAASAIRDVPTGASALRAFVSARVAMWNARSTIDTTSVFFLPNAGAAKATAIAAASRIATCDRFIAPTFPRSALCALGAFLGKRSSRTGFAGL